MQSAASHTEPLKSRYLILHILYISQLKALCAPYAEGYAYQQDPDQFAHLTQRPPSLCVQSVM